MLDTRPSELEALRKLKKAPSRDFRLIELRVFDPKARGDSNLESDIDGLFGLEELDQEVRKYVSVLCCDLNIDYRVVLKEGNAPVIRGDAPQRCDGVLTSADVPGRVQSCRRHGRQHHRPLRGVWWARSGCRRVPRACCSSPRSHSATRAERATAAATYPETNLTCS